MVFNSMYFYCMHVEKNKAAPFSLSTVLAGVTRTDAGHGVVWLWWCKYSVITIHIFILS